MIKRYISIETEEFYLKYLIKKNVSIKKIKYLQNRRVNIIVSFDNYKKYFENREDYIDLGLYKILAILKKYKLFLSTLFLGIIFLFFLTNIILGVKINHSNKELRNIIMEELDEHNIRKYSLKKSYNYLNKFKKEVLEKYKDQIEWLEIKEDGMFYIVNLEERIIKTPKKETSQICDIYATKDAVLKKIVYNNGYTLKDLNDFVRTGDLVISGSVLAGEEVKNKVCASGKIYGEVWYEIQATLPKTYESKTKTNKKWFNIEIETKNKKKKIFKSKYKNHETKNLKTIKIFNIKITFLIEKKIITKTKKYDEKTFNKRLKTLINEKIAINSSDASIISQKVLKKKEKESKIEVDIFVVVLENITGVNKYNIE